MATPNSRSVTEPIILEGRTVEKPPLSAPQPRFKVDDIAYLRVTGHDGVMTRRPDGFNPGTYYMIVRDAPDDAMAALFGTSFFSPTVIKAVSWDSSEENYFVLIPFGDPLSNDTLIWLPEDQGGLLKPMHEVGDKVYVRSTDHQHYLLATILERAARLDVGYSVWYKLDTPNAWVEEMKIVRGVDGSSRMESDEKYEERLKASGRNTSDLSPPNIAQFASYLSR